MEVLHPRCAGLDVHAGSVTACARIASGADVTYEHRTVATTTRGLLDLAEWLSAQGCTHVAMEATGVYWKPVWHVLEESLTLILANAMHIRAHASATGARDQSAGVAHSKDARRRQPEAHTRS